MTVEHLADGGTRINCDAPGCTASVAGRWPLGQHPKGWTQDLRRTARTAMDPVPDYCPEHAGLASA